MQYPLKFVSVYCRNRSDRVFAKVVLRIISSCPLSARFSFKIFGDLFFKRIKHGKSLIVGVYRKCQQRQSYIRKSRRSSEIIYEAKT